jgi:hypothetical protein
MLHIDVSSRGLAQVTSTDSPRITRAVPLTAVLRTAGRRARTLRRNPKTHANRGSFRGSWLVGTLIRLRVVGVVRGSFGPDLKEDSSAATVLETSLE